MREHQKILSYIHDLKFCAAHMRKGHLSEMVKSATKFGSCITVLVEEMLSSKVWVGDWIFGNYIGEIAKLSL